MAGRNPSAVEIASSSGLTGLGSRRRVFLALRRRAEEPGAEAISLAADANADRDDDDDDDDDCGAGAGLWA